MMKYRYYWRVEYVSILSSISSANATFQGPESNSSAISTPIPSCSCKIRTRSTDLPFLSMNTKRPSLRFGRPPEVQFYSSLRPSADVFVLEFIKAHPEYLAEDNAMNFISDDGGHNYNLCHCKSLVLYS